MDRTGKYVLQRGASGKYRFNLVSTNGKTIATSEAYDSKRAALAGIEAVRRLAASATLQDHTEGQRTNRAASKSATPAVVSAVEPTAG